MAGETFALIGISIMLWQIDASIRKLTRVLEHLLEQKGKVT